MNLGWLWMRFYIVKKINLVIIAVIEFYSIEDIYK